MRAMPISCWFSPTTGGAEVPCGFTPIAASALGEMMLPRSASNKHPVRPFAVQHHRHEDVAVAHFERHFRGRALPPANSKSGREAAGCANTTPASGQL